MSTIPPSTDPLATEHINSLLTLVEEATRSTEEGVKYFVEPAEGALRRATSRRHHIVFGRRGSGKSSLLRKAATDLTVDRRPIAWVDLEPFKGHSYPDLLLSVLIKTFEEFKNWMETAAVAPSSKTSFWKRLFGSKPTRSAFNSASCKVIVQELGTCLEELKEQLHAADAAKIEDRSESGNSAESHHAVETGIAAPSPVPVNLSASVAKSQAMTSQSSRTESFSRSKTEFLQRNILEYKRLFSSISTISSGDSYLFLDDLYQIRRPEQARVIDYLHSVAKNEHLWLKIGTIRHRSTWYKHGEPPIGIKLGDDADEIDLDLTLEKYSLAKTFLSRVLEQLSNDAEIKSLKNILTDTGLDRLVLASGGVARDFLSIFRRSVNAAKERGPTSPRGPKVGAEDVNLAAGEYDSAKREEFTRDTYDDEESILNKEFAKIRAFCLDDANCNCFLVAKDLHTPSIEAIHELVDLKLLHLIRSRVTVNSRKGLIYEAYMLDLSQYAGSGKKRDLDLIEFWRSDAKDQLRKVSLILYDIEKKSNSNP